MSKELLAEIARNTRVIAQLLAMSVAREAVVTKLEKPLETQSRRTAYAASDGERSAREVARLAGTTHGTIGAWWQEWILQGLGVDHDGRMRATLDLELLSLGPAKDSTK